MWRLGENIEMKELSPGDRLDDHYTIDEILGKGAMGHVYLVRDDDFNFFAIKEMASFSTIEERDLALRTFYQEVKILENIKHSALPQFFEKIVEGNKIYIVMEYISGDTLEKIIQNSSAPLEEKNAVYWAIQICEIFYYLHTLTPEPIIYRDLKPANIIISNKNIVRLIDFGIARHYDPFKDSDTLRLGTPGYAAPEQCRKQGQSTPRSDIYSLGVLLHQLLTLHDPSTTPFRLPPMKKFNTQISDQLEWIIKKAIELDPANRYLDSDLFKEELLDYYQENCSSYVSPYKKINTVSALDQFSNSQFETQGYSLTPERTAPSNNEFAPLLSTKTTMISLIVFYLGVTIFLLFTYPTIGYVFILFFIGFFLKNFAINIIRSFFSGP